MWTVWIQRAGPSGRSPSEIVGSNLTGGMDICLLWLLSGIGFCDELIAHPEESYQLWCVVCDLETLWMRRPWPNGGCCTKNKHGYKVWWIFPDVLKGHNAFVLVSWSIKTSGNIHPTHKTYTAVRTPNPMFSLFIPTCMITCHGRWLHIVIHRYLLPLCKFTEIWSP